MHQGSHPSLPPSPTLTLTLYNEDDHRLDFISPQPLNIQPLYTDNVPPPLLLSDDSGCAAVIQLSPQLTEAEEMVLEFTKLCLGEKRKREEDSVGEIEGIMVVRSSGSLVMAENGGLSEGKLVLRRSERLLMLENGGSRSEGRVVVLRRSPRFSMAENVGRSERRMVVRSSIRSLMAENREKLGLRRSPRTLMLENGGRLGLRRSPRSSMAENGRKLGLRSSISRYSMAKNGGKLVLRSSIRSSMVEKGGKLGLKRSTKSSMAKNGGKLGLRSSIRSSMVKNGGKPGSRSSPRSSMVKNGGKPGSRSLPRSSMVKNGGKLGSRSSPRSLMANNGEKLRLKNLITSPMSENGGKSGLKRSTRSSTAENGGKSGLKRSTRSSMAENGGKSGLKRSTRSSMAENGGKSGLRRSTRSSTAENGGKSGLKRSTRSSMAENGGKLGSKSSTRSSMVGGVGENGLELGLRRSPRSSEGKTLEKATVVYNRRKVVGGDSPLTVGNVEKTVGGGRSRSSTRSSMAGDVVENGLKLGLRRSPRSSEGKTPEKAMVVYNRCKVRGDSPLTVGNVKKTVGEGRVRSSSRSSMAESVRKNGVKLGLRCSPRLSEGKRTETSSTMVNNRETSMAENSREKGRDLSCPSRSSPMVEKSRCSLNSTMVEIIGEESEQRSPTTRSMEGNWDEIDEEKVLRRSPRGLPSSLKLDDDVYDDDIKLLVKRKKKMTMSTTKVKIDDSSKNDVLSPIEKERRRARCFFVGDPVAEDDARQKWRWRYELQNRRTKSRSLSGNDKEADEPILNVKCHYTQAQINGTVFNLGDCALIRGDGKQKHIGRIIEFLQTVEDEDYFRVQWFYKAEDTVMKEEASFHRKKRIFYSTIENDNMLDCIISKLNVTQASPELTFDSSSLPPSDYYYDMEYSLDCSTFRNLPRDDCIVNYESPSNNCPDPVPSVTSSPVSENVSSCETYNLLDIYAGCGAMSTGLCIGARHSGVNLVTRWAIELDSSACKSLRLNHSETQVRNEAAEDFLELLKHWEKLCKKFVTEDTESQFPPAETLPNLSEEPDAQSDSDAASEELEVLSLVDICYGSTDKSEKQELKFKVRWKGYGPDDDTWEPMDGLSNCQELIQDFVINGFKRKMLPLPGDVDVICGGPPCQGISGYNRFRCVDDPLSDERNRQLIVFMDIVDYLKPKFVLMENVTDILKFDKGSLGRYALSRLVHMRYQARVGIMAAGCYGIPQFRLRAFFWGALPSEELPQFPLPTHDVVVRHWPPLEFERNVVGYDEGCQPPDLEVSVVLGDAISDLPVVTNFDSLDEMLYNRPPETEFQKYIRSNICGYASKSEEPVLYDHRPLHLFEDDYIRVCKIPRKKGANFRDLPGVIVGNDNVVRRDPSFKTLLLPSGKPMVPEYAFTFEQGKSKRPFARLWWDETMPTVVTYPSCHCQAMLHPEQDRVLTIRECARLQGFPDSYRLCGSVKQRYRQVGNAVAIPVAKALGYTLGMAFQKRSSKEALVTLPPKFAYSI